MIKEACTHLLIKDQEACLTNESKDVLSLFPFFKDCHQFDILPPLSQFLDPSPLLTPSSHSDRSWATRE